MRLHQPPPDNPQDSSIEDLQLHTTPSPTTDAGARGRGGRSLVVAVALILIAAGSLIWWLGRRAGEPGGDAARPGPVALELEIGSEPPGARIWVDGVDRGLDTPATVPLGGPSGSRVLLELRREGRTLARHEVVLEAGATPRWHAELPLPFEIVSRPAGARVVLDGVEQPGPTPITVEIDPGARHELRVELDGYHAEGLTFSVAELAATQRQRRRLDFPLRPLVPPGFLVVEAGYRLQVEVGGERYDVAGRKEIELAPGSYRARLRSTEVRYAADERVTIRSGRRAVLTAPRAATLRVVANPGRCRLRVDGRDYGWLPADVKLIVGEHDFEFLWDQLGRSRNLKLRVGADSTSLFASPDGEVGGLAPPS